jgi:hypothetical protein
MCSNELASIEVTVNRDHTWPLKRKAEETNIGYIGKSKIDFNNILNNNLALIYNFFNSFQGQIAGITNLCRGISLISVLEAFYFLFINPFFN